MDLLFKMEEGVFSYRVAGICLRNGRVLLQTTTGEDRSFAFPGGHVSFGETNEQTLIREFREETGLDIRVGELKWVAEIFFPWGEKTCHQICLYYLVEVRDESVTAEGKFIGREQLEDRNFDLEFHWVPIEQVKKLEVYPVQAAALLEKLDEGVQHFIYRE
jgi:8-oxo-dGTP pyrophosphatase MutT (NUDIX family)